MTSNSAVILDKTSLLWDSTYSSFFMSFSMNWLSSITSDGYYCIALAKEDESKHDTFNILLFSYGGKTIFTICFFFNNTFHDCYFVNPLLVWIGVWTNYQTTIFFISSSGFEIILNYTTNFVPFVNPVVCVGYCVSSEKYGWIPFPLPLGTKPIIFIRGIIILFLKRIVQFSTEKQNNKNFTIIIHFINS